MSNAISVRSVRALAIGVLVISGCALGACASGNPRDEAIDNGTVDPSDGGAAGPTRDDSGTAGGDTSSNGGSNGDSSGGSNPGGNDNTGGAPMAGPDYGEPGKAGKFTKHLNVGGADRTYILFVPEGAVGQAAPVVVSLHGAGDTASNFFAITGLKELATAKGFILIVPQSDDDWIGKQTASSEAAVGSYQYITATVVETNKEYPLDVTRLYLTGFSRGAAFVGAYAQMSGQKGASGNSPKSVFAAYAISSGYQMFTNPDAAEQGLSADAPKRPIWLIHHTQDDVVPFAEGERFYQGLESHAWPDVKLTRVEGGTLPPHNWLWQPDYGHSVEELWTWLSEHPCPAGGCAM